MVSTAMSGQYIDVLLTTTELGSVTNVRLTSDVITTADPISTDHLTTAALYVVVAVDQCTC